MPVYKVTNNSNPQPRSFKPPWVKEDAPPSTPSVPPWRRQQQLKDSQGGPKTPSSPGINNDAPVFPKPAPAADTPKTEVLPTTTPGRKSSKITIIPSNPVRNGSSSILAVPPPIPAPPPNPTLERAPRKSVHELPPTKINLQSKLSERKKSEPAKQEYREKVVPIKIETKQRSPSPPPKAKSPPPKAKSPPPVVKPVVQKQASVRAKSPSPPPSRKFSRDNLKPVIKDPVPKKDEDEKPGLQKRQLRKTSPKKSSPPPAPKTESRPTPPASKIEKGPTPPAPPPMAPPLPPPPPPPPGFIDNKKPVTQVKKAKIESLKSRPRKRPDWAYMMKELESGVRLKHVECNDRSKPIIPKVKAKGGQFVYESEKGGNAHNQLLSQIQRGVNLKTVKTNDRSKPILDGLRKFRRQLTIEEKTKSSGVVIEPKEEEEEVSEDDLDDIDKVRDDLQSTKQMLEFELREKERLHKENRRLGARILNLEEDAEKLKLIIETSGNENSLVTALREEIEKAKAAVLKQESINQDTNKQYAALKAQLEDSQHRNLVLEKRIEHSVGQGVPPETSNTGTQTTDLQKVSSRRDASIPATLQPEPETDDETEEEEEEESSEEESESELDEEAAKAAQERRVQRELKMLQARVKAVKDKESTIKNERTALKYQMSNLAKALKVEQKKFKLLQKEVDKMAKLMKEEGNSENGSDDEEEDEENQEEEESEEETEESESESEPESEEEDKSQEPPQRIEFLNKKAKARENVLTALKKGNYMLKVNIDKLKDDLEKQREKSLTLQEDLNAVLAELG